MLNFESFRSENHSEGTIEKTEEKWKWKEFSFESGVLYLTQDAKTLDKESREKIYQDIRAFQKEKPPIFHTGSDGSVYLLNSGKYVLKEQKLDGKELMEEHAKVKELIDSTNEFPADVQLVQYLAIVEPPYLIDEFGRRSGPEIFEEHKTEVAVGAGAWTRQANICSYVVMPFLGEGVNLSNLHNYSTQKSNKKTKEFVQKMIQNNIIPNEESVSEFSDQHFSRIENAFQEAQKTGDLVKIRDFAKRNIVVSLEGNVPQFHIIDL